MRGWPGPLAITAHWICLIWKIWSCRSAHRLTGFADSLKKLRHQRISTNLLRFRGIRPDTLRAFFVASPAARHGGGELAGCKTLDGCKPARYESRFGRSAATRGGRVLEKKWGGSMKRINRWFSRDFWGEMAIIGDIVTIKPDARFKKGFRLFIFVYLLALYATEVYGFYYILYRTAQLVSFSFLYWGFAIFIFALMCQQKEPS